MKNFIVYNSDGKILRTGLCQDETFLLQADDNESVLEDEANAAKQKVVNDVIVDMDPEEIEAVNPNPPEPEPAPYEKRTAHINNEQWQDVLKRLSKLETET